MGALDGLFVVAIEQAVAAPTCTLRLADAGARVVKIEREGGETARNYDTAVEGTSAYFAWLNRGKESAVLDLKAEDDLSILRAMLKQADVLVQNLAPGAMGRMGLTAEFLEREFPQLIVVSILGYGQDTPYADMRAYDLLVQAESGICNLTGTPETPVKIGVSATDIGTGMNAHAAVLEALIARGKTGKGQQIEISMFDGMADWSAVPLLQFEHTGKNVERHGLAHSSIYPYGPFECSDGTVILAVQSNSEWAKLCENVVGLPELVEQAEFLTNADRSENRDMVDSEIAPVFAAMTTQEALAKLKKAGVAFGKLSDLSDLSSHPALRRIEVPLPEGKMATMPRPAGRDSNFKANPVPSLGQHTDAIRQEFG